MRESFILHMRPTATVNIYQGTYAVDNGVIIGFDVLLTG